MREINYRGFSVYRNGWVFGLPIYLIEENADDKIVDGIAGWTERYDIEPESLGELTTLKDKNGRKVWEGDILSRSLGKHVVTFSMERGKVGFVLFENKRDKKQYISATFSSKCEVVGNIYQNPELLKELNDK